MNGIQVDIAKRGRYLIFKEPFYGHFLLGLDKEVSTNISTACVALRDWNTILVINPEYWESVSVPCRVGILKHELMHVALGHLFMKDVCPDQELFNIAADLEINQYIDTEYKDVTWQGLDIKKSPFKELKLPERAGTREYYKLLQQETQNNPNGDISNIVKALKDHNDSGSSQGPFIEVPLKDGSTAKIPVGHELWEQFEKMTESEKKLIKSQIEHQIKQVAEQVKRSTGNIPGELESVLNDIENQYKPVIDWKKYFRLFAGLGNKTYLKDSRRKLNKRFIDSPGIKIKKKQIILVAIDTSGSVSDNDLKEFLGEVHHIWRTGVEVDIIQCDTHITDIGKYTGKRNEYKIHGRGGTSFNPVSEYLNKNRNKYMNLIYFTDGEASPPDPKPCRPVLWVHCSTSTINDSLPGTKVQINEQKRD